MIKLEGLSPSPKKFGMEKPLFSTREDIPVADRIFHFTMEANGYAIMNDGQWDFSKNAVRPLVKNFIAEERSFFGPVVFSAFFSGNDLSRGEMIRAFEQQPVIDSIAKYREIDIDQAARIAFLFGGIVRHLSAQNIETDRISDAVAFAAKMTSLGQPKSADAIACAMGMYVISGGSLDYDNFKGNVYHMGEAVAADPILPENTVDLGVSQVARLRKFIGDTEPLPDISEELKAFEGFPTSGAEFHFPLSTATDSSNLWQRLAVLNMSQYQPGSSVQFSRNDRGVIEVRMNPSVYPITIANWKHMELLLPELKRHAVTATFNRQESDRDFHWDNIFDSRIAQQLNGLGLLTYASVFQEAVISEGEGEIDFGTNYIGQTVRLIDGEYRYTGQWVPGNKKGYGQISLYAGFAKNFDRLAYYPSMALANPAILEGLPASGLSEIRTLKDAMQMRNSVRRKVFERLNRSIEDDEMLRNARDAGISIMQKLRP